jgi:DNA ligase 1
VLLAELVATSAQVAETSGRLKKIELLAQNLRQMNDDERAIGARYLAGELPQKTGIGYATVAEVLRQTPPASTTELTLTEIDRRFTSIADLRGAGSANARKEQLGAMLSLASAPEQQFLGGLAVGEVRQGALDGLVVEAIAKAAELPADSVRRAYMLSGDLGEVAAAALAGGAAEIGRFGLTLFRLSRCSARCCRCSRRRPTIPRARSPSSEGTPRSSSSSTAFASSSTRTAASCARTRGH